MRGLKMVYSIIILTRHYQEATDPIYFSPHFENCRLIEMKGRGEGGKGRHGTGLRAKPQSAVLVTGDLKYLGEY